MKDIFEEDKISPINGLLQRYKDRVLVELTLKCPSNCDFCYRKWKVNNKKEELVKDEIDKMVDYVAKNKDINEIIFSGGEPLLRIDLLEYGLKRFSKIKHIKIFRIHTRAPITKPDLITKDFLKILSKKYNQVIYLSVHVNCLDELTKKSEFSLREIRDCGVVLYSQSVFLKGINDSVADLEKLFLRLLELGIRPYNIYHCNKVEGNDKYIIPIEKEIKIMTELRKRISGLACPNLIIDIPGNANKIPAPTFFWDLELGKVRDFDGVDQEIRLLE